MELIDIPSEVIIYVILPYLQYVCWEKKDLNVKTLFGYFKSDCMSALSEKLKVLRPNTSCNRKIWLIWRGISLMFCDKIELKEYPLLTSLKLEESDMDDLIECPLLTSLYICGFIRELKEYPLLTSLSLHECFEPYEISELIEYPFLTSLTLCQCFEISELKEYPLLNFLKIKDCSKISELKEYPLLTSLTIDNGSYDISELKEYSFLTSLYIKDCKYLEDIETKNREEIQQYIKKYIPE